MKTKINKIIAFLMLLLPLTGLAQQSAGIHFEQQLSWKQILEKAKTEHKYIFVDCYATWCGPCKLMDQTIYPLMEVGDYYNSRFISVKVQMDQTNKDDSLVKSWHPTAGYLAKSFSVTAFPTFLFFDPNGIPVHKVSASKDAKEFIQLGNDAQDPDKQYYNVLKNFQPGKLDTLELKGLARAFTYSDKVLAGELAADYLNRIPKEQIGLRDNTDLIIQLQDDPHILDIAISYLTGHPLKENLDLMVALNRQPRIQEIVSTYINGLSKSEMDEAKNDAFIGVFNNLAPVRNKVLSYIDHLANEDLYRPVTLRMIVLFTDTSAGRGFELFYRHGTEVDTAMHIKGFARGVINPIVYKEEVAPQLVNAQKSGLEPDWEMLAGAIKAKFGDSYAGNNIMAGKTNYYYSTKQWYKYIKYFVLEREDFKDAPAIVPNIPPLNNAAWEVFTYSNDKEELQKALVWADIAVKAAKAPDATISDTRANLLYKLGRKDEALKLEAAAAALAPKDKDIQETYTKMQQDQPTWPVNQ